MAIHSISCALIVATSGVRLLIKVFRHRPFTKGPATPFDAGVGVIPGITNNGSGAQGGTRPSATERAAERAPFINVLFDHSIPTSA